MLLTGVVENDSVLSQVLKPTKSSHGNFKELLSQVTKTSKSRVSCTQDMKNFKSSQI